MERVIVTVVGKNRIGVLAEVTGTIGGLRGNILDISQKMMQDYFNLIMLVEIGEIETEFAQFKERLEAMGESSGFSVSVQHERVFSYMHRI